MTSTLCPTDRYLVFSVSHGPTPVYTTPDVDGLFVYLWGRDMNDGYVVYDYEIPYPMTYPDLMAFLAPLRAAATSRERRV
jgi:hypothetical protein